MLVLVSANPEAEPSAEPSAEAEASPDGNPEAQSYQYSWSSSSSSQNNAMYPMTAQRPAVLPAAVPGAGGGWSDSSASLASSSSSSTGLTNWASSGQCGQKIDECCNMADQGCCVNEGQKCYTVWEKQCQIVNQPQCKTTYRTKCANVLQKGCGHKDIYRDVEFEVQDCQVSTEERCWPYEKKICQPRMQDFTKNFTWSNERLESSPQQAEICAKVRKCNIEETEVDKVTKVPDRRCEKIPYKRPVCRVETVQVPPVMKTTYTTEYRQQCFNVPKPVCKLRPCQYAVQTQQICPITNQPLTPGSPCGGGDACGGGGGCGGGPAPAPDMCGACRQQNVQMCTKMTQQCETVMEKVCQQVPIRVPQQISVPSPPRYEKRCDTVTEYREQCRVVYVQKIEKVPKKTCNSVLVEKCEPYSVPNTNVVTQDMEASKTFTGIKTCEIATEQAQHCARLPTKEICQPRTVRRRVKIKATVCDRKSYTQVCKRFPDEECRNLGGQVCQNVPREVCQPSCPQTTLCNSCQNFQVTGGFEQCQQPTCPNYIN